LRIPCDLTTAQCQNITLPLYDAKNRAPYKMKKGTLIENIIIMAASGACIDNCMTFALGSIAGANCASECDPQRWVSESCPVSGAQLNKCGVVKVNLNRQTRNCDLFLCKSTGCPGQCELVNQFGAAQAAPCCATTGDAQSQSDPTSCAALTDENGCPVIYTDGSGCCSFPGGCAPFAGGELAGAMIGITLLSGSLRQSDITFAVETWERCCLDNCEDVEEDVCQGVPRFQLGGH